MPDDPSPVPAPASGTGELTLVQQARLVAALRAALQAERPGSEVSLIETHISFVLLTPEFAYKFKKVLNPGFLDYTTLALRRHWCDEELRLNRRSAPALYLDVVGISGSPEAPQIGGSGPVIEVAVRMRAFAQDGLWDRLAGRGALHERHIDALVTTVAAFHAQAAVADAGGRLGSPAQVRAPMQDNLQVLDRLLQDPADRARLATLAAWEPAAFVRLEPVFAQRLAQGRIRECHGDLHLGNVTEIDGHTTVFDCIEFNDDFRWIDVISDVAFMAMDLQLHGLPALANRFVNGWLEHSGDYAGLPVLRYYVVHRALVRAKVQALRAEQAPSARGSQLVQRLLVLAEAVCRPAVAPVLMITHGLSGSGKTTLSQDLLQRCGALRIRSDVERKRLFGVPAVGAGDTIPAATLYGPAAGVATYRRLFELAAPVLEGGFSVVLDATFLQRQQRDEARRVAAAHGMRCIILDFDADPDTLRERVRRRRARGDDASDADVAVLDAQLRSAEALAADEAADVVPCRGVQLGDDQRPHLDGAALQALLALLGRSR